MDKNSLKQIIVEQKHDFEKNRRIVERDFPRNFVTSDKIVVTGVRRSGKSTLLCQLSKRYGQYFYFNFEDERLIPFSYNDFNTLLEAFYETSSGCRVFFFDEIQNITGWEKFVRRLFSEGNKIFVTGSNAKLLSSEIATSLTGRNLKLELYPFSFKEYLSFHSFPQKSVYTTREKAEISKLLGHYTRLGGFPEIAKSGDSQELAEIYQDIIVKDIIARYGIRDTKSFRELALYLLSNISKKISYNNLKNLLGFSTTSKVKNYVEYLQQAYLFFTVPKFDYSVKKQLINDRKIFACDTGMVNAVGYQLSENTGRMLENTVFLELKRRNYELYYYENRNECDFLIKKGTKIVSAIQAAATLQSPETRKRELTTDWVE